MLGTGARYRRGARESPGRGRKSQQRLARPFEYSLGLVVVPALDLGVERYEYAPEKDRNDDHRHGELDHAETGAVTRAAAMAE